MEVVVLHKQHHKLPHKQLVVMVARNKELMDSKQLSHSHVKAKWDNSFNAQ